MHGDHYVVPAGHPLQPFVHSIWQVHTGARPWSQHVLPRGFVDLLFPLEGTLTVTDALACRRLDLHQRPFVVGLQRGPVGSATHDGLILLGISLRSEATRAIVSCPAHELSGLTVPANEVLTLSDAPFDRLQHAPTFRERAAMLLKWLAPVVRRPARLERLEHACMLLRRGDDAAVFDRAASAVGWSGRHLRRTFLEYIGTTPGEYVRLGRFKHALSRIRPQCSLTDVAHIAGYHDQAHFCRDFKELAGLTPGAYRDRAGQVPGILFSSNVRLIQASESAIV